MRKGSKKLSRDTETPLERLQAVYICDLRVWLEEANKREQKLVAVIERMTDALLPEPVNQVVPAPVLVMKPEYDANSMNDVATYDESEDAKTQREHDAKEKELEKEFLNILGEHEEAHAQ